MIAFGYALVKMEFLAKLVEDRDRAEGALMVLTAGLAREDEISELDRRMHLHAAHIDVLEKRIDDVKKDLIRRNEALAGDIEVCHESLVKEIEAIGLCGGPRAFRIPADVGPVGGKLGCFDADQTAKDKKKLRKMVKA